MYLTILMPCLNEEKTIAECITKAKSFLMSNDIVGEILIVDNGSTDNSVKIAKSYNVRVIIENKKGYGNALISGIKNAKGKYTIFGDCDCSYDFSDLAKFIDKFNLGYEYVNGNRFKGGIEKGAMPFSHKIGVPILSVLAKIKYKVPINDFHCGLRGFKTEIAQNINFLSTGMEFATEIIEKFAKLNAKMTEVPIILYKDKRNRKPHLNTIKDGFRHLKFILWEK